MDYNSVKSSNLKEIGYDKDARRLHVRFLNGSEYAYHDVPEDVHKGLMDADSAGKHLNANIIGKYRHQKI